MDEMVYKGVVIQVARDVLFYHHKLFDKLKKKILQASEVKQIYGYEIGRLVAFAEACRIAHISDDDIKKFLMLWKGEQNEIN